MALPRCQWTSVAFALAGINSFDEFNSQEFAWAAYHSPDSSRTKFIVIDYLLTLGISSEAEDGWKQIHQRSMWLLFLSFDVCLPNGVFHWHFLNANWICGRVMDIKLSSIMNLSLALSIPWFRKFFNIQFVTCLYTSSSDTYLTQQV